jgi:predicted lipoprotein with Yx(FWY)xxD motif
MKTRRPILALALAACASAPAFAEPAARMSDGRLVDTSGRTLYSFDRDSAGKSACNGPCATLWPPAIAAGDAKPEGDLTLVTRDDGAKQWAWKGKPVYTYSNDKKAGEATGDNFRDVWHVIK